MFEFDAGAESGHTHRNLTGSSDGWWENWQADTKGTTPLSDYDLIRLSVCVVKVITIVTDGKKKISDISLSADMQGVSVTDLKCFK